MPHVKALLIDFLRDPQKRVAVLKGDWGIGKTYFWREFIKAHKSIPELSFYSYVSLFGLSSIKDVMGLLFANLEPAGSRKGMETLRKHVLKAIKGFGKISQVASNICTPNPYAVALNTSIIGDALISKCVSDCIVCVDDLERVSDSISMREQLGFFNRLKEERNCKILLIYNEGEIRGQAKEELDQYREKVVDLELTYSPTVDDNFRIIFKNEHLPSIKDTFNTLAIKNIRIMERVKNAIDYFSRFLNDYKFSSDYTTNFLDHVVKLCILRYNYPGIISIEKIPSMDLISFFMKEREKEDLEKSLEYQIFDKVQYLPRNEDVIVIEYFLHGWVNPDKYTELLVNTEETERKDVIAKGLNKIWRKYHDNFMESEKTILPEMKRYVELNWRDIGIRSIFQCNQFIKKFKKYGDIDDIEDQAIEEIVPTVKKHDLPILMLDVSESIRGKIEKKLKSMDYCRPIPVVIDALSDDHGFDPKDIAKLQSYSEDDFYSYFTGKEEVSIPKLAIFVSRLKSYKKDYQNIYDCVQKALLRVGSLNEMNRSRVAYILGKRENGINK